MHDHQQDEDPYPFIRECEMIGCHNQVVTNMMHKHQLCDHCIVKVFLEQLDNPDAFL